MSVFYVINVNETLLKSRYGLLGSASFSMASRWDPHPQTPGPKFKIIVKLVKLLRKLCIRHVVHTWVEMKILVNKSYVFIMQLALFITQ